jgi:hypothetical protein
LEGKSRLKFTKEKGRGEMVNSQLSRKNQSHKCKRLKHEKVRMVIGLDVGVAKVEGLMEKALVRRSMGKFMKGKTLLFWIDEVD